MCLRKARADMLLSCCWPDMGTTSAMSHAAHPPAAGLDAAQSLDIFGVGGRAANTPGWMDKGVVSGFYASTSDTDLKKAVLDCPVAVQQLMGGALL